MKEILFLMLIFGILFLKTGFAQEEIKDGLKKTYYPGGVLKSEIPYKDGKIEGTLKNYYPDGKLKDASDYLAGVLEGRVIYYYDNGQIELDCQAKEGFFIGECRNYYPDGKISGEFNYGDSQQPVGIMKIYYENGTLKLEANYKDGQLDGIVKEYDEDGNIVLEEKYGMSILLDKNGDPFKGNYQRFYKNGVLESETFYVDGRPKATKTFYENGKLRMEGEYGSDLDEHETNVTITSYETETVSDQAERPDITIYKDQAGYPLVKYREYDKEGRIIREAVPVN